MKELDFFRLSIRMHGSYVHTYTYKIEQYIPEERDAFFSCIYFRKIQPDPRTLQIFANEFKQNSMKRYEENVKIKFT